MLKRLALIAGALFAIGCAALMNSNRPRYDGPVVGPAWHNAYVKIEQTPVIHEGVVYAVARPFSERDWPRVYAFDLKSGASLWAAGFPARAILLAAGSSLFVADDGGRIHSMNAKTGAEFAPPDSLSFAAAAASQGFIYTAGGYVVEAWPLASLPVRRQSTTQPTPPLWQSFIPPVGGKPAFGTLLPPLKFPVPPVAAGGTVYVYAFSPEDYLAQRSSQQGLYAFDARTGTLRWKWEIVEKFGSHFVDGMTADAGAVYVWLVDKSKSVFGTGVLVAFDAATGKEKWRHTTSMYVSFGAAPLLLDPNAVVIADYPPGKDGTADEAGFIYRALDRATGARLWESKTAWKYRISVTLGGLMFVSDQKVHEVLTENNNDSPDSWISAVNLRSGKEMWRSQTVELGIFTAPAAGEGMVVVGSKPFTWADPPRAGKKDVAGLWAWTVAH